MRREKGRRKGRNGSEERDTVGKSMGKEEERGGERKRICMMVFTAPAACKTLLSKSAKAILRATVIHGGSALATQCHA